MSVGLRSARETARAPVAGLVLPRQAVNFHLQVSHDANGVLVFALSVFGFSWLSVTIEVTGSFGIVITRPFRLGSPGLGLPRAGASESVGDSVSA